MWCYRWQAERKWFYLPDSEIFTTKHLLMITSLLHSKAVCQKRLQTLADTATGIANARLISFSLQTCWNNHYKSLIMISYQLHWIIMLHFGVADFFQIRNYQLFHSNICWITHWKANYYFSITLSYGFHTCISSETNVKAALTANEI